MYMNQDNFKVCLSFTKFKQVSSAPLRCKYFFLKMFFPGLKLSNGFVNDLQAIPLQFIFREDIYLPHHLPLSPGFSESAGK